MANTTFNTRIALKYDTYENWTNNDPVLLAGEVAIVVVPASTGAVAQEPAILFKVGDGTSKFSALPFGGGVAADVYSWAKSATKPSYQASEISGLEDFISGKVEDTNTKYNLVKGTDAHEIKLQKQDKGESTWTDVVTITTADTVYDDSTLSGKISALENLVGNTAVATQIANAIAALDTVYEKVGVAATEAGKVQTALNTYKQSNDAVISAIKDGTSIDSFKDVETALAGKQATGDYATKTEAQGYANAKDSAIAEAKKAGTDAQAAVDDLKAKVGTVPSNKTVVELIEDSSYDDSALSGRVSANEAAITKLNGTGEGSVKKAADDAAASAINTWAQQVTADNDTVDTFKELVDYVAKHAPEAATMAADILEAQGDITSLKSLVGNTAVATQITNALDAALKLSGNDKYALASALTEAVGRITTLENTIKNKVDTSALATVAKSGEIADLKQTSGYIVLNCGSSTVNV